MKTKLTFLGTGTSQGIPIIGCDCPVCSSSDPRDRRLRASALVEYGGITVCIDCGPDFRQQILRAGVRHLDAILLTHNHKDHTGGLDEVRSFNLLERKAMNIYCEEYVENSMRKEYSYAFAEPRYPGSPEWHVHRIDGAHPFLVHSNETEPELVWESGKGYHSEPTKAAETIAPIEVIPIQGWHHKEKKLSVLGYRFGDMAYLTDMNNIEEESFEKLRGVKVCTINTVKLTPHFSHFSLPEAVDFLERVGAEHSYITHLSHLLPKHTELDALLPENIHPAYDGLTIEL